MLRFRELLTQEAVSFAIIVVLGVIGQRNGFERFV